MCQTINPTAAQQEYQALISMLDDVFFASDAPEQRRGFMALLPKLYKEQYAPWENNYVVREGDALKAAVGMYVTELSVAGQTLRCGGIGNVAVTRDCRRKGYMKQAMDSAMRAMAAAGCDFGELGGHRLRYQYWGFERGGAAVRMEFTRASVRHCFGEVDISDLEIIDLAEQPEHLPKLQALIERAPMHVKHSPAMFYDLLCSWKTSPRIVLRGNEIAAYFALNREGKGMNDFHVFNTAALPGVLNAIFALLPDDTNAFEVSVPLWERALLAGAQRCAEWLHPEDAGQFTILNYERTLRALLALQCGLKALPDGELIIKIVGTKQFANCIETLRLCVKDQQSTVEPYEGTPDITLPHIEAVRYFTGFTSPERDRPLANAWFPLPLFMYDMDKV